MNFTPVEPPLASAYKRAHCLSDPFFISPELSMTIVLTYAHGSSSQSAFHSPKRQMLSWCSGAGPPAWSWSLGREKSPRVFTSQGAQDETPKDLDGHQESAWLQDLLRNSEGTRHEGRSQLQQPQNLLEMTSSP